jgi:hypothetical protein
MPSSFDKLLKLKFALMVMKIFGEAGEYFADGALVGLSFEDFGFAVLCWGCGVGGGRGVSDFPLFPCLPLFPCILAVLVDFLRYAASLPTLVM